MKLKDCLLFFVCGFFLPIVASFYSPLSRGLPKFALSSENERTIHTFDDVVRNRYSCKGLQPSDSSERKMSRSRVINFARECLKLAQYTPTSFNLQPYAVVLVSEQSIKDRIAPFALGPNSKRIKDADCTAIFLADTQVMRTLPQFWTKNSLGRGIPDNQRSTIRFYLGLFSSGYAFLPRFLMYPLTKLFRFGFAVAAWFSRRLYPLPSLTSTETWAARQACMVAMTYMYACTARGLATIPMEGYDAVGIRRVLGIPSRYQVTLLVSTGLDTREPTPNADEYRRYPYSTMIFENGFKRNEQSTDGIAEPAPV